MNKNLKIRNSTAEFLIFTSQSGEDGKNCNMTTEKSYNTVEEIGK